MPREGIGALGAHLIYDALGIEIKDLRVRLNYRADPVTYLQEVNS